MPDHDFSVEPLSNSSNTKSTKQNLKPETNESSDNETRSFYNENNRNNAQSEQLYDDSTNPENYTLPHDDFKVPSANPLKNFFIKHWGKSLIVLGILIALIWIISSQGSFSESRVDLSINTQEDVRGGDLVTFTVEYKNNNKISLVDAKLIFIYPEGSIVEKDGSMVTMHNS